MNMWIRERTSLIFSKTNLLNDYRNTSQHAKSVADSQSIRRGFKEVKRKSAKGERERSEF